LRGEYYTPAPIAEFAPTVEPQGRWTLVRTVEPEIITRRVERFLNLQPDGQARPGGRERSWDFCFNYFQAHAEPSRDLELSCLQLGYYLASWGMLRGSSYLFRETNSSHYVAAINIIEDANPVLRGVDADHCRPDPSGRLPGFRSGRALGPSVDRDQFDPRHAAFVQ
jgi:hypothetical protein